MEIDDRGREIPRKTSLAEDAAERDVETRWGKDAALRAEFRDDYEACVAYHVAVARGVAHHTKQNVRSLGTIPDAPPAAPGQSGAGAHASAAPALQRWNANVALRAEFVEFEFFEAFDKANAAGRAKILGQPAQGQRDGSAAAPIAAPIASTTDAPIAASVTYGTNKFVSFDDFYAWRRGFAAKAIECGELDEAVFRANLAARWNEMAHAQQGDRRHG
jgi:hypothetical protein